MTERRVNVFIFLSHFAKFLQCVGLVRYNPRTALKCPIRTSYMVLLLMYFPIQFFMSILELVPYAKPVIRVARNSDVLKSISGFLMFGCEHLSSFLCILVSLWCYKEKIKVPRTLFLIDDQLFRINIVIRYRLAWFRFKIVAFIFYVFCKFALDCYIFNVYPAADLPNLYFFALLKYSVILVTGSDLCHFLMILHFLRMHFKVINDELVRLAARCERNSVYSGQVLKEVKILYKSHSMLKMLCLSQNKLYGASIHCVISAFLIKILTSSYFVICETLMFYFDCENNILSLSGLTMMYFFVFLDTSEILLYFYILLSIIVSTKDEVR